MWLITGGLDLVMVAVYWIALKLRKIYYVSYWAIFYFLYHSVAVVCVYKGWVPNAWLAHSKDIMENSILMCFIGANAIPLLDFK